MKETLPFNQLTSTLLYSLKVIKTLKQIVNEVLLQMTNLIVWVSFCSLFKFLLFVFAHKILQGKVSRDPNVNQIPVTRRAQCHGSEPSNKESRTVVTGGPHT